MLLTDPGQWLLTLALGLEAGSRAQLVRLLVGQGSRLNQLGKLGNLSHFSKLSVSDLLHLLGQMVKGKAPVLAFHRGRGGEDTGLGDEKL